MTEEIDGEGEEIVDDLHRATVEENKQFHDDSAGVDPSEEQEDTKHTELWIMDKQKRETYLKYKMIFK